MFGQTHHAIGQTASIFGVLFAQVHTCIDGVDVWVDMGGWADVSHVWADVAPSVYYQKECYMIPECDTH